MVPSDMLYHDGRVALWGRACEGRRENAAGGQTREIAKLKDVGLDRAMFLGWSPDGKYIACDGSREEGGSSPILVIPVEGGKPTMLAADKEDGWKTYLQWSPDGKWISYRGSGEAKVRPAGTLWEADFEEIVKKASR